MAHFTQEELDRILLMRQQRSADCDREKQRWDAAYAGYEETETYYVIQYMEEGRHGWISCDPFYAPLRLDRDRTHSKAEAYEVAAKLLAGEWATRKQAEPGDTKIAQVQVIECVSSQKILKRLP